MCEQIQAFFSQISYWRQSTWILYSWRLLGNVSMLLKMLKNFIRFERSARVSNLIKSQAEYCCLTRMCVSVVESKGCRRINPNWTNLPDDCQQLGRRFTSIILFAEQKKSRLKTLQRAKAYISRLSPVKKNRLIFSATVPDASQCDCCRAVALLFAFAQQFCM